MNTGGFAFDTVNKTNVQILDRIEAWGYVSYRVFDPSSGKVYKLAEDQLTTSANLIMISCGPSLTIPSEANSEREVFSL